MRPTKEVRHIAGKYALQDGAGEMTIEAGAGGAHGVSIMVTTPAGCIAGIENAMGIIKDNGLLWATRLTSNGKTQCLIEVKFDQQTAEVLEKDCPAFHRIARGFAGTYAKKAQ